MAGNNGKNDEDKDKKKGDIREIIDATNDFVMAVIRGGAKGWGSALKALGEELEKFGEEVKSDS